LFEKIAETSAAQLAARLELARQQQVEVLVDHQDSGNDDPNFNRGVFVYDFMSSNEDDNDNEFWVNCVGWILERELHKITNFKEFLDNVGP
jgi:hypothetical protein